MKIGIIGCGAIGSDVAIAIDKIEEIEKIYLYDIDENKARALCKKVKKAEFKKVEDFLEDVDVVFEAASSRRL